MTSASVHVRCVRVWMWYCMSIAPAPQARAGGGRQEHAADGVLLRREDHLPARGKGLWCVALPASWPCSPSSLPARVTHAGKRCCDHCAREGGRLHHGDGVRALTADLYKLAQIYYKQRQYKRALQVMGWAGAWRDAKRFDPFQILFKHVGQISSMSLLPCGCFFEPSLSVTSCDMTHTDAAKSAMRIFGQELPAALGAVLSGEQGV